ncbi:MAG: hypothetical protein JOZ84_18185 [Methylobacteriaceae bacterium]|nr:hypothetical protein [Methylobacteriaceae bacterium]
MTWRNCLAAYRAASARWRFFRGTEAGVATVLFALAAPLLIGAMGLAAEVSYWRVHQRGMQNAADAAAIAAATNGGSTYVAEAQAVAAQYGFQNGVGNIAVTVTNPTTTSGCTSKCYEVQISDKLPLLLTSIVGFSGNTTITSTSSGVSQISTKPAMSMQGASIATSKDAYKYCIVALGTSGVTDITSNGAQKADLGGCNIASNAGATCNGGNLNAGIVDAHGAIKGCGTTQNANTCFPNQDSTCTVTDAYAPLASSIPADTCNSVYPAENSSSFPMSNQWTGTYTISGYKVVCGDQKLIGPTTISGGVLVIENGQLDTNGYTLTGNPLTIVFSGSNASSSQHIPRGSGGLNIAAPTSGPWSGVAIYQDPSLTANVSISSAGNSPTWNISGLVYLPHAAVTLSGSAGASTSGAKCFMLVVDHLTINGTGSVLANDTDCTQAGLNQMGGAPRGTLVN